MTRGVWLALLALVLCGCASRPGPDAVPAHRQVLVVLDDSAAAPLLAAGSKRGYRDHQTWAGSPHVRRRADGLTRDHGLRELHAWRVPGLALFCLVLEVPPGAARPALIRRLGVDPRVTHAQPVNEYRGLIGGVYDDPLFEVQYGEHRALLESVHALTTGRGVRVAIVDGPVDDAHEDLRGQIARQVPDASQAAELAALRHGTAVAGVIAAAAGNGAGVVGMAPQAAVTVYAACQRQQGGSNRCTTVTLAQAIEQAIADQADVINLSLAGPPDWLLERLLQHAHAHGAVLVAADDPGNAAQRFPASLPFVHGVAGGAPWFARDAQFSTRAGGGYQLFFGSSMSSAGAAGMAALLRALHSASDTSALLADLLDDGCLAAPVGLELEVVTGDAHCR